MSMPRWQPRCLICCGCMQVLLPMSPEVPVSDEVFKRTPAELKRDFQRAREKREQSEQLMTRAMREKLAAQNRKKHLFARVRIRFPEGLTLQGAGASTFADCKLRQLHLRACAADAADSHGKCTCRIVGMAVYTAGQYIFCTCRQLPASRTACEHLCMGHRPSCSAASVCVGQPCADHQRSAAATRRNCQVGGPVAIHPAELQLGATRRIPSAVPV